MPSPGLTVSDVPAPVVDSAPWIKAIVYTQPGGVLGLGDDNNMYVWSFHHRTWKFYGRPVKQDAEHKGQKEE